jgi:myb proto-oncogene protein
LEEERQLMAAHRDLGNRWVEIAKRIDGRTDSGCKNHFHKSAVQHRWKTKGIDGGLADPSPMVAKSLDTAPQSPAPSDESKDEEASAYALLAMLQQTPES